MKKLFYLMMTLTLAVMGSICAGDEAEKKAKLHREHPYFGGYKTKKKAQQFYGLSPYPGTKTQGAASSPSGSQEIEVTTLVDRKKKPPKGSLRWALQKVKGPRRITFKVSGIIFLDGKPLGLKNKTKHIDKYQAGEIGDDKMNNYVTIDGSGADITITGNGLNLKNVHDVVIKNIRIRPGDDAALSANEYAHKEVKKKPKNALKIDASKDVLIDQCSLTWHPKQALLAKYANNLTIKDTLLGMAIDNTVLNDGKQQAFGSLIRCHNTFIYRCLYAHVRMHAPKVGGADWPERKARTVVANSVVYNYGEAGSQLIGDMVPQVHQWDSNYYLQPQSRQDADTPYEFVLWSKYKSGSKVYLNGNKGPHDPEGANNWDMVLVKEDMYKDDPKGILGSKKLLVRYPKNIKIIPADEAYNQVISTVGAMPRDCIDERLIASVTAKTNIADNEDINGRLKSPDDMGNLSCVRKKRPKGTILDTLSVKEQGESEE